MGDLNQNSMKTTAYTFHEYFYNKEFDELRR